MGLPASELSFDSLFSLLGEALVQEINSADTVDEFVSNNSVISHMVTTYNTRKEGKQYVISTFQPLFIDLCKEETDFAGNAQTPPNLALLTKVLTRLILLGN